MAERNIAVLGGGHGARTVAADMALSGHRVTLFEMERFSDNVQAIFDTKEINLEGNIRNGCAILAHTTHNIKEAVSDKDLVLIVVPAFAHAEYARLIAPHLSDGQNFVLIPGTFGSLEFVHTLSSSGRKVDITVSELDTLPYATRIVGPNTVRVYHRLPTFCIGVFPSRKTNEIVSIMKGLYPNTEVAKNVLEAGLSNCNPVIHPLGVLLNAGRIEYSRGEFWYYEEGITPSTAKAMEALDEERKAIGRKFGLELMGMAEALHAVGYGPKGDLWETLKGSKGLTPIKGPTSLSNRYVTEDIPVGLVCWSQLGEQLGVATPLMKATVEIGIAISGRDYWQEGRTLEKCGIKGMSADEIIKYVTEGEL